jgi:hypothetical protein
MRIPGTAQARIKLAQSFFNSLPGGRRRQCRPPCQDGQQRQGIVCQSPEGRAAQGLWTALRLLASLSSPLPARRALPQALYERAEFMTIDQRFPGQTIDNIPMCSRKAVQFVECMRLARCHVRLSPEMPYTILPTHSGVAAIRHQHKPVWERMQYAAAVNHRPGGEIGRRTGLKIPGRKACGFDSRPGHHHQQFGFTVLRNQSLELAHRFTLATCRDLHIKQAGASWS